MEFVILDEKEFNDFAKNHEYASFMQTKELASLKKELGDIPHFLGVKEKNKLVGATLVLEENSILGSKTFYAPRGFLIDYSNFELLKFFTDKVKEFVKSKKGFRLTIDPNVIYRIRSSEGDILDDDKDRNDVAFDNLIKVGFKHFGWNLYTETLQVRWEYRLKLDKTYEELKQNFSKSTRKNIDACYKKGLRVRRGEIKDLDSMTEIFESTSKRRDFHSRSLDYYKKMYKHMKKYMTIYIAYLDPEVYLENTRELLNEAENKLKTVEEKMQKDMVGSKLLNQKETALKQIDKYREEMKKAEKFKEENPHGKDVGALLSLKSGDEYLTLSSGVLEEYKSFTPKYAMYNEHIKDALEGNFKWVDFYGITGVFDKSDKYYGIYEFKKGFGGNVVELIGQFETKITGMYDVYNLGKKVKHIIKK